MRYLIIFLFLISCSDKKIEKALASCSDYNYFKSSQTSTLLDQFGTEIINGQKYQNLKSDIKKLNLQIDNIKEENSKLLKEWDTKNPWPKFNREIAKNYYLKNEYYERLNKLQKNHSEKRSAFIDNNYKKLNATYKIHKQKTELRNNLVLIESKKIFENMSLDQKAKTIKGYTEIYSQCEKTHAESPKAFMLSWSSKK